MPAYKAAIERLEQKYLITEAQVGRIRRAVEPYCVPDEHNGPDGSYLITSLYLDTPTLALHRATVENAPDRYKLRVRTYADTAEAYLEVKRKVKSVISKHRAAVPRDRIEDAARGLDVGGGGGALEAFASRCVSSGAEPVMLVSYEREAYDSDVDAYARVTFDRRLRYQPSDGWRLDGDDGAWRELDGYWHRDGLQSPVILELKCETRSPWWLIDIVRDFELRRVGFSKYSKSVLDGRWQRRGSLERSYG